MRSTSLTATHFVLLSPKRGLSNTAKIHSLIIAGSILLEFGGIVSISINLILVNSPWI
ncbi:putative transmembrane protein [Rhizoctonia solani 123E]|uniref:Putative transmembrane protein n=1 Tax=Rhizoctonia solani 123E TaxID=1423351 RepID=A0A074S7V6_9AGAM|nr:putative transmembrane protein [Rhizoctonia solani 123E]